MLSKWWCSLFVLYLFAINEVWTKCPSQEAILPCRCLTKGEKFQIWCSHSNLESVLVGLRAIAQHIPQPIDELILENNFLPSLPGRTFLPLKILRLMLRYNGLERISSDWLVGLETSLMELFLVEPDLRSLPPDSLHHLLKLEAITIQSNLMKRYPFFSGLTRLKYLQLESLSLLELSAMSFRDLHHLEAIHISNSPRLAKLDANFLQDLPRLALVNISFCGISWMHPRAITRLPLLHTLSLVGNKIADVGMVGRAIRDLPHLENLHLDYNLIDKVPEAAFVDLPSIRKVHLSNNQIVELQYGAFHRVPKLRSLYLNKNNLRRVHPESFLQSSNNGLEELHLIDNDIGHVSELRSLLDTLPRLTFLDLSYNNLEEIPFGALRGHPSLEHLHLDYNKLEMVDGEAFMAMPALRELRLKNNSLSNRLNAPLWNLPSLKGLDLSGNFYRRLDRNLLQNLPSLRRIDLSRNELTHVEPEAFLATPALEHVNLSYNGVASFHPGTFRHLLNLFELDVNHNILVEAVPNLPQAIEYLHMSHNRVQQVPLGLDLSLPALKMLDLSANEIHRLPPNAMRMVPQLRRLYLGRNALQRLDEKGLTGLGRLEVLDLYDNKIALIHPNALQELAELKELNLRSNRLDVLFPELFRGIPRLKRLIVSHNQLGEILEGTLVQTRDLHTLDASSNYLVQLPPNLHGLKKLKLLDLNNNRLKNLQPETLSSLESLRELKLAHNFIAELRTGAFDGLPSLRTLHLDDNELEVIEPNAVRALPALKTIKLARNKLHEIPNFAFSELPALQIAELQENEIVNIGNDAFHQVPHLLMLNLSGNLLGGLDEAGLKSLNTLEMLDVSGNRINRVTSASLEKMEWLVELRMNDNRICAVHGSPFDGMPRLRVLNMRNNRMMALPEQAVQKVRTNIAVLELDGNPLVCGCSLLWLKAWLQEGGTMGPRCADGSLVREMRLSRLECPQEQHDLELVAPGCEAELLTAPGKQSTAQMYGPHWMKLRTNVSKENLDGKNSLAPSPEESEYFYEEYVDYPYNETGHGNWSLPPPERTASTTESTSKSPNFTTGDTPTIYAASGKNKTKDIPKEVSNSPSTSGFTFFGVPLPNLGLNNLWGSTRNADTKPKIAERKVAIVNSPVRGLGGRINFGPPNTPEIQTGGFIPLLPGTPGGFTPIQAPNFNHNLQIADASNQTNSRIEVGTVTTLAPVTRLGPIFTKEPFMGHPIPSFEGTTTSISPTTPITTPRIDLVTEEVEEAQITEESAKIVEVTLKPKVEPSELETVPSHQERFEDIFDQTIENVPMPTTQPGTKELVVPVTTQPSTSSSTTAEIVTVKEEVNRKPTPLSSLLVPGGQQPEFRPAASAGRSTITKVPSPHAAGISGAAPLYSDIEVGHVPPPQPHNREGKTSKEHSGDTNSAKNGTDTSWYFANYNKTNLEPFVGVGGDVRRGNGGGGRQGVGVLGIFSAVFVAGWYY